MDNITHSLAGLLLAEAAIEFRRQRGEAYSASARSAIRVGSALANNLNDADFLYARHWAGKLGYLVNHRGHTHTLPVALLLGVLVFGLVWGAFRLLRGLPTTGERRALLAVCLLGPFVHIGMDFSNSYGVHPFWPFDVRWFYGDTLFIIEPWLWVFAVPPLCGLAESRPLKVLLVLILGFVLILCWFHPLVHWVTALFLALGSLGVWRLTGRLSPARRLSLAALGWLLVFALFLVGTRAAERQVTRVARVQAEARGLSERIVDVVITPTPGNPLCASALVVARAGEDYSVRAASVALAPWLLRATRCRVEPTGFTAGMRNAAFESSAAVHWEGEWQRPLSELWFLQRSNCWARAMLRFARVPFWQARPGGRLVLGDLRYDRLPGEGFAEVHTKMRPDACPEGVPHWQPPREDLLSSPP